MHEIACKSEFPAVKQSVEIAKAIADCEIMLFRVESICKSEADLLTLVLQAVC